MAEPILTVEFKGLWAFVSDEKEHKNVKRVAVIAMAADKAVPKRRLCRHDPLLILRGKEDFWNAGSSKDRLSFQDIEGRDLDVWQLNGKDLVLKGLAPGSAQQLTCSNSYEELLSLEKFAGQDAGVHRKWVNGGRPRAASSRLLIDHGALSADLWSDEWALALGKQPQPNGEWFRFRQLVRWEVYGEPESHFLRLEAGVNDWIELEPGAKVVLSNLCPLSAGGSPAAEDVLAYYRLMKKKVPDDLRFVLYARPPGANGNGNGVKPAEVTPLPDADGPGLGNPTRPGTDACPPVTGWLV